MIDIKLNKKEKKVVEKEVRHRLYVRAKKHASDFRKEFKKQLLFAVSAAFGFLMAFSWREPIMDFIGFLINSVGIKSQIYDGVISAVVLTVVGVLFLMVISKWASEKE
jgi:uncharacterized membrane protein YdbT with pleckstrin-like domain